MESFGSFSEQASSITLGHDINIRSSERKDHCVE